MIHLESFCAYLKIGWIKRLTENMDGSWQKIIMSDLQIFGGERVLSLEKEKIKEFALNLKNSFWRDVFFSFYTAKPCTKENLREILSLDILYFVPVAELSYYIRWKQFGIQYGKVLSFKNIKFF